MLSLALSRSIGFSTNRREPLSANGSRGLFWLEPMIEVETAQGRVAYGPVGAEAVPGLFDAGFLEGKPHELCLGLTEEIPYLKRQERLTLPAAALSILYRFSDYVGRDGYKGLQRALTMTPEQIVEEVTNSGFARTRWRGLSDGHQMENRSERSFGSKIHRVQRRRGR